MGRYPHICTGKSKEIYKIINSIQHHIIFIESICIWLTLRDIKCYFVLISFSESRILLCFTHKKTSYPKQCYKIVLAIVLTLYRRIFSGKGKDKKIFGNTALTCSVVKWFSKL